MTGTAVDQGVIGNTFAGAQVMFDFVTHGSDQYAAWYNIERNLVIRHRKIDGAWSDPRVIKESTYNPDINGQNRSFRQDWDSHKWIRLGVDSDGNVHMAADHHGNELRYWRTTTPGDLNSLKRFKDLVYSGPKEDMVTYPEMINGPSGNLRYMMYRDGSSGNGSVRAYEWNSVKQIWTHPAGENIFAANANAYFKPDGNGNAYTETYYTLDGWYHIVYCWRRSADGTTCSRLSYVRTKDFETFYTAQGKQMALPIYAGQTAPIVDDVPEGTPGFVNQEWQFIRVNLENFIAYVKDSNLYVAHCKDGEPWKVAQMTTGGAGGPVGGMGNGFLDNYISILDSETLAVDFSLDDKGPSKRVTFPRVGWDTNGPYPIENCPQYFPNAVYPTPDTQPGISKVYVRTCADGKSVEQTHGIYNRTKLQSRPVGDATYVMSWLCGPDTFTPNPGGATSTQIANWPARPIHIWKVTG